MEQRTERQLDDKTEPSISNKGKNMESPMVQKASTQNPSIPSAKHPSAGSSSPPKKAMASSHYSLLRFPLRVGITWKKGERLEAMDFSRTWYPSKIVEIDEDEKCILIHFEGWNSRYDEWFAMDSEELRPQTRHSERKDKSNKKRRNHPHPVSSPSTYIYHAGDQVLARWTDCKKYPAKINRAMEDDSYEVIFYDGVTRIIQPINIQPMPEEMKLAVQGPLPSTVQPGIVKSSFKDVPLKLPDHVLQRTKYTEREKQLATPGTDLADVQTKSSIQPKMHSLPKSSLKRSSLKKKFKTLPGLIKREKQLTVSASPGYTTVPIVSLPGESTPEIAITTATSSSTSLNITSGIDKNTSAYNVITHQHQSGFSPMGANCDSLTAPMGAKCAPLTAPMGAKCDALTAPMGAKCDPLTAPMGAKRVKKRAHTDSSLSAKKKRHKFKKTVESPSPSHQGTVRAKSFDLGAPPHPSPSLPPLVPQYFVPSKAFIVEEDHNHFKCPHEGCGKAFRKENLLNYHIKYYHSEPETASVSSPQGLSTSALGVAPNSSSSATGIGSPLILPSAAFSHGSITGTPASGAKKRRKKTDSVCSTDSDLSISSRGKSSSRRQRHDSEISVTGSPDLIPREAWADVKIKSVQDSPVEDNVETEEVEMESDLVNCVCGIKETNGLMIQCDVCMCWQHFMCVDTKGTGIPPANYVCLACERPKGLRDSCRYMYDMGFERRGELPTFSFSSSSNHQTVTKMTHLKTMANKFNSLSSVLLGIKSALHSSRRQIKISKEEDDREFQLWQTDWDNWTKPEEDLTLTPHSVDPVPSPTPSTFLFPPTPTPPATSALSPSASSTNQDGNLFSPSMNVVDVSVPDDDSADTIPFLLETLPTSTVRDSLNASSSVPTVSLSSTLAASLTDGTILKSVLESSSKLTSVLSIALPSEEGNSSSANHYQSTSVTPPSSRMQPLDIIPQTPSLERRQALSSHKEEVSSLVCDLFPGPGGDAASGLNKRTDDHNNVSVSDSKKTLSIGLDLDGSQSSANMEKNERCRDDSERIGGLSQNETTINCEQLPHTQSKSSAMISTGTDASSLSDTQPSQALTHTISSLPFCATTTALQLPSSSNTTSFSLSASSVKGTGNKPISDKPLSSSISDSYKKNVSEKQSDLTSDVSTQSDSRTIETHDDRKSRAEIKGGNFPEIFSHPKKMLTYLKEDAVNGSSLPTGNSQDAVNSPNHISELYIDVNEGQSNTDECEEDNDTDTAEESADPYRNCERNLLVHISNVHSNMEAQLLEVEHSIAELEKSDLSDPNIQLNDENVLNDIPALRKSLRKLLHNLSKVRQLSSF